MLSRQKWIATVRQAGKRIFLGRFLTEQAAIAHVEAAHG